jgi:starch phosphorylase
MLREYVERLYLPSAARVRRRTADHGRLGKELLAWQHTLRRHWPALRFGAVEVHREHDDWYFMVTLFLAGLDPAAVTVELYADPLDGELPVREPLAKREPLAGEAGWYRYQGRVRATRPAEHFTPRVIPAHGEAQVPLEESHILWFR